METWGKHYDRYLTPEMPEECGDCEESGCIGGEVEGHDGTGYVKENCKCTCHTPKWERDIMAAEQFQDMMEDR